MVAISNYEEDFESYSTGSFPSPWQHYQDRAVGGSYCSGSSCEVGYNKVVDTSSSSGSKSLECLERSNGDRHCYIPIQVPSSATDPDISLDYKVDKQGPWTHAKVCLNDDTMFQDNERGNCELLASASNNDSTWNSISNHDLSPYKGETVYLDLLQNGRHDGDLGAWGSVMVDDIDINANPSEPPSISSDSSPAISTGTSPVNTVSPVLEVYVSDPDTDNLDVTFYRGSSGTDSIGSDSVSGGSGDAKTEWTGLTCGSEYTWSATVTDGGTTKSGGSWTFEVNCNDPPVASFTRDTPVYTGEDFGLDASASSDPDSDSLTYNWDLDQDGDYDDASGVSPSASKPSEGSFDIGLKVNDGNGGTDTLTKTIEVEERPKVEVLEFDFDRPYNGIVLSEGGTDLFGFDVLGNDSKEYSVSVTAATGVESEFQSSYSNGEVVYLNSKDRFLLNLEGSESGMSEIEVTLTDESTQVKKKQEFEVRVRDYSSGSREVSGIAYIQVLTVIILAYFIQSIRF